MGRALTGLTAVTGTKKRDDEAAYSRAWYARHRDKMRLRSKEIYRTNREKRAAAWKEQYERKKVEDPEYLRNRNKLRVEQKLRSFGLTPEAYVNAVVLAKGRCAICGETPRAGLQVDHCHSTETFRGLLCRGCNTALGKFKDSEEMLLRAVGYLRDHRCKGVI